VFLPYVKDYVNTFIGKSITTEQWKSHLYSYFKKNGHDKVKALDSIDWNVSKFVALLSISYTDRNRTPRHGSTEKDSSFL
jgi:hypothetical protein